MNNDISTRIESRIDKATTSETGLSTTGAMAFSNVTQIMEFSKVMAIANVAVPKHLRDNPGACLAVAIQASEWEMSPFSVANKCYVVNDRLAYEAQLIAAVILRRAPIKGRFRYSYSGDGPTRKCKVEANLSEGGSVEYESPEIGKIPVKNSPLWKNDPDQQLGYYAVRSMARRHFPDVIMGVYSPEEMAQEMRDVTPAKDEPDRPKLFKAQKPEPVESEVPTQELEEASEIPPNVQPPATGTGLGRSKLGELNDLLAENGMGFASVKAWLKKSDLDKKSYVDVSNLSESVLENVIAHFSELEA